MTSDIAADKSAVFDDDDPVSQIGDDIRIVGDKEHRDLWTLLQIDEQIQDLRLNRYVERGHGLIADQDIGGACECRSGIPDLPSATSHSTASGTRAQVALILSDQTLGQMTSDSVSIPDSFELRSVMCAARYSDGTADMKMAAGRRAVGARQITFEDLAPAGRARRIEPRNRFKQRTRVGMGRA
jgi:hypothetical protein